MKHTKDLSPVLGGRLRTALLLMLMAFFTVLILPLFAACGKQNAAGSVETKENTEQLQSGETAESTAVFQQPALSGVWDDLFIYDEAESVQFQVRAAIPGEEETYQYPWGEYDDRELMKTDGNTPAGAESNKSPDAGEANEKLQKALEAMSPEKRKIAEEAMAKAQKQTENSVNSSSVGSSEKAELPPDWHDESNQPVLGGRLELQNGETRVIIEMSEYCVEKDTVFTVTPIKANKLQGEIIKSGFSLTAGEQKHVLLNDYAVVTFITGQDPGDDVVIKSFNPDGTMEYTAAEVARQGDTFKITGAVEHFSTVGYGSADLSAEAAAALNERAHRELIEASGRLAEKMRFDTKSANDYKNRKFLETIEFDEIIFTTSASGDPLQLHLRAKLVEQPFEINPATNMPERYFTGKIWLKFYTWMNDGYGMIYMICNNAKIPSFYGTAPITAEGNLAMPATLQMTTIGGSRAVSLGVGEFDISGKTYSDVQTTWQLDPKTNRVQITFNNMKGAAEKTFITGKLCTKSKKQANKKLKWFLN